MRFELNNDERPAQADKRSLVAKLHLIFLALACAALAPAKALQIVNAASLSTGGVVPGSIITIFRTNLATGVAATTNVQKPPTSLGGVSVTIGGVAPALFYVSPTQVNAAVDPTTSLGMDPVVVTSGTGK